MWTLNTYNHKQFRWTESAAFWEWAERYTAPDRTLSISMFISKLPLGLSHTRHNLSSVSIVMYRKLRSYRFFYAQIIFNIIFYRWCIHSLLSSHVVASFFLVLLCWQRQNVRQHCIFHFQIIICSSSRTFVVRCLFIAEMFSNKWIVLAQHFVSRLRTQHTTIFCARLWFASHAAATHFDIASIVWWQFILI